ncbi:MAG: hypothetical protein FJ104_00200 [Deltaproteobacteria bacterium]|nr:hypothetical protein [Deltaproteobacteria bacterium]
MDPTTPGEPRLDVAFMLATGPSAVPPDPAELDAEVGALLRHARRGLPDRAITVVTVDRIEAYAAGELTVAGALAFTPTLYHHPDDFPARNGVLVGSVYRRCGAVPGRPSPRAVAHELGHMALDVNHHEEDTDNLMSRMLGRELTAEQCERMRQRIALLYGDAPLADPGPPRPG